MWEVRSDVLEQVDQHTPELLVLGAQPRDQLRDSHEPRVDGRHDELVLHFDEDGLGLAVAEPDGDESEDSFDQSLWSFGRSNGLEQS